uniref:Uncharacterized protein n=1 Tax=Oryza glumipatula TaxID=40148 RepID=A0A0D9ZC75_9ORYZ
MIALTLLTGSPLINHTSSVPSYSSPLPLSLSLSSLPPTIVVLPCRLRQSTTAVASVPMTPPTLPMNGTAATRAEAVQPIGCAHVSQRTRAGGGHPFLGGGDYQHNHLSTPNTPRRGPHRRYAPRHRRRLFALWLLSTPHLYHRHRMLSSTGHLHGVLADTLRGYSAIAIGSIYRLRLHGGSSNSLPWTKRAWRLLDSSSNTSLGGG